MRRHWHRKLVASGRYHGDMFFEVRTKVSSATRQEQIPWTQDGLLRRVHFAGEAVAAKPSPQSMSGAAEAVRICREVEAMASVSLLGVLASQHKGTPAADCIAARIDELRKQQVAVAAPPPAAKPAAPPQAKPALDVTPLPTPPPGTAFRDCPTCPEMVVVPAGSFTMGSPAGEEGRLDSEGPQHKVTIGRPFAVGKFAVTFAEWEACVGAGGCNGYQPNDQGLGRGWRPVINVSWDDAKAYVAWISKATGKSYRLLSEAEREYVARAGTTTPFWWGSSISTNQANYNGGFTYGGGSKGENRQKTVPADSFAANPWGLYQVHGNVWEWVEDCWHGSYQGAPTDGSAWTTSCTESGRRVLRGGSWGSGPDGLRAANRGWLPSGFRSGEFGFRVGRMLTP